jgi:hypothetical protein
VVPVTVWIAGIGEPPRAVYQHARAFSDVARDA